jgi:acyl carrier protein
MKLETLIAMTLNSSEASLVNETELKNIPSWDSMAHMVLITAMEKEYSVQFSGDEIAEMKTVGEARRLLRGHGVSA